MPTSTDDVTLLINGKAHSDWSSYDIDSHLQTPGDAWRVEVALPPTGIPAEVVAGASIEVRLGSEKVLVGKLGRITAPIAAGRKTLTLSGRDMASQLLDCAAPIFSAKQLSLSQIVAQVVKPLGVTKIQIKADSTYISEKVNVEPGDRAWNILANAAEANGLWPWFTPDGTLIVGGPDYTTAPVATLIMRADGVGNNVESLEPEWSMDERYSEVTVLGQKPGTSFDHGKHAIKGKATDSSVSVYRPHIVVDHQCESVAQALSRARKLLMDGRLKGFTLTAKVMGHRTSDGVIWTPGQRLHVMSEPHGLNAIYFLMGRRLCKGRAGQGTYTILTLKEDKVWTLDAHAHKGRKKKRKSEAPQEIINVGTG